MRRGYRNSYPLLIYVNISADRSLTPRQRDILQQYADDVEGRSSAASQAAPESPTSNKRSDDTVSASNRNSADPINDNGTASFTYPSASPEVGWISRLGQRIRGLIGF